jgi:hypothetical protein
VTECLVSREKDDHEGRDGKEHHAHRRILPGAVRQRPRDAPVLAEILEQAARLSKSNLIRRLSNHFRLPDLNQA